MTRIHSRMSSAVSAVKAQAQEQKPKVTGRDSPVAVRDRLNLGSETLSEGAVNDIVLGGVRSSVQDALSKANVEVGSKAEVQAPADTSAESTARHIFQMSTGSYGEFRASRPDLSEKDARSQYSGVIGEAINNGVDGAVAVLRGLSILMNADLFTKVERTRSLVNNMVNNFVNGGL
jgi:hypothetical protein